MKGLTKKGFTLIELLAVILILGIIALIAIPTVSKVIKESKKGAFKSSSQNIVMAVEQKCQLEQLKGEQVTKYYRIEDGVSLANLDIKGELPSDGSIVVDDECNVNLIVNKENYIAVKNINDDQVTIIENKYYKPGESVTYNPGDSNYTNWYVLKDNGDTLTMILLNSLTNSTVDWASYADYQSQGGTYDEYVTNGTKYGPVTALKKLSSLTNSWNSESKKDMRLLNVADVLDVLGVNNFNMGGNLYFDTKSEVMPVVNGISKYAWLFNNTKDCLEYGCDNEGNDYSYWLSDYIDNTNLVYAINYKGRMGTQPIHYKIDQTAVGTICSIRPVITIPKTSIQ